MHLRTIARRLMAATTLSLAVAASPALGQVDADLAVTFSLRGEADAETAGLTYGGTETFRATITNNGPSHVTEFTLTATVDAALTVVGVPGCEPVDVTAPIDPFPCVVTPAAPGLISGASMNVDIRVVYPVPDNLDPTTATCPAGAVTAGISGLTISGAMQGATAVNDPTSNNGPLSAIGALRNWADLEVTSITGPANAGEGQSIQYVVTLTNNGPCGANDPWADFIAPTILGVPTSLVGDCQNDATSFFVMNDAGCDLGIDALPPGAANDATLWPAGATRTINATFTVGTYPSDLIHAGIPIDVAISSLAASAASTATDDPIGSNDADSFLTQVDLSDNDGCSTGGAGTLLGLLSLVALRLGRRRAS
jgi:MYXO-CTERM domain-containing protein